MQLAQAVDHGLVGGAHMLHLQARVFVDELLQYLPHAVLVTAALRLDAKPCTGTGNGSGFKCR